MTSKKPKQPPPASLKRAIAAATKKPKPKARPREAKPEPKPRKKPSTAATTPVHRSADGKFKPPPASRKPSRKPRTTIYGDQPGNGSDMSVDQGPLNPPDFPPAPVEG